MLYQYVEDQQFDKSKVDPITVLHQAMKGLAFLHSIGISKWLLEDHCHVNSVYGNLCLLAFNIIYVM